MYQPGIDNVCFGVLINKYTVLTAASCVPQSLTLRPLDFHGEGRTRNNNVTFKVPFEFTHAFPDWTSILRVFVGLYNDINYNTRITPTDRLSVATVYTVRIIEKLFLIRYF